MIAAMLWSCVLEPRGHEWSAPPPSVVWHGDRGWNFVGGSVYALNGADSVGSILVNDAPTEDAQRGWRLDPRLPGGTMAKVAIGEVREGGQFLPDLDGNGRPEILINGVAFVAADTPGSIDQSDAWLLASDDYPAASLCSVPCGDFNGDGVTDLIHESAEVRRWFGPLGPTFAWGAPDDRRLASSGEEFLGAFALHQPDGSSVLVVVRHQLLEPYATFADVELPGGVVTTEVGAPEVTGIPRAVADLDGAPGDEVLLSTFPTLTVYEQGADGGLIPSGARIELSRLGSEERLVGAAVGDFDGDGQADVALSTWGSYDDVTLVTLFRGPFPDDVVRTLDEGEHVLTSDLRRDGFAFTSHRVAVADVDADGRDDVVVGAPDDDTLAEDGGAVYLWLGSDLFP